MQGLLWFVTYCSILLWLSNPAANNTSQRKAHAWVAICQLIEFHLNILFLSWLSEGSWCICLLVVHVGEDSELHCLESSTFSCVNVSKCKREDQKLVTIIFRLVVFRAIPQLTKVIPI